MAKIGSSFKNKPIHIFQELFALAVSFMYTVPIVLRSDYLKNHPMIRSLLELRGNPRACVYTEPLWGIPHSLYSPFISVYMSALALSDRNIGAIASLSMLSRAIFAMLSGAITDKLGRRKATVIFDILSWSVPCLIWAFAQNFWWFMVAAALNGLWQITDNSWNCLLVEDADKSKMVSIYSWIHVSGQLAVFFAPISALIVNQLTLIPAMRILYLFAFVSMTAKFIILYKYGTETRTGEIRMRETNGMSIPKILSGYGEVAKRVYSSRMMRLSLALNMLFSITSMITQNFYGLYATQNLALPQYWLAYFPIIRSAVILLFLFFIQSKLTRFGFKTPMLVGVSLYISGHLLLIFSPTGTPAALILYTILEACAHGLVMPRKDSITALFVDERERARINSVMTMSVLTVSIPFGYIAGFMSDINRILPFILDITIFTIVFLVIAGSRSLSSEIPGSAE